MERNTQALTKLLDASFEDLKKNLISQDPTKKNESDFTSLQHEISFLRSSNSENLLKILEELLNLLKNLEISNDVYDKVKELINLKINESDILNSVKVNLILYFSLLIRKIDNDKESSNRYKVIYDEIKKSGKQDVLSPVLFFVSLFYATYNPKSLDDAHSTMQYVLTSFDVFEIIRTKWLKDTYKTFSSTSYKIFNHAVFHALKIFFFLMTSPEDIDQNKIVPLLLFILSHQSKKDEIDTNFFSTDKSTKMFGNRFDKFFFLIISNEIKDTESAKNYWTMISSDINKFQEFIGNLQTSLNSISLTPIQNEKEDKIQALISPIKLLYKFTKYLDENFEELMFRFFNTLSIGINQEIDYDSKYFISFIYFITDFLWKPKLCVYAAKILEKLTKKNPTLMAYYYNALFENNFADVVKIIDESANDHSLIVAFIKAANHFVHFHYSYQTNIPLLPHFIKYFIFVFFPTAIYRKYQSQKAQWKILTKLIKTANELIMTDYYCLKLAHENKEFITTLITLIIYAGKNICLTFANDTLPKRNIGNKESSNNSNNSTLEYKDINYQLNFEVRSLELLQNLISIHLLKNEQPTLLYKELFNDQWISDLISLLIYFLTLSSKFDEFEILLYEIGSLSLNIFELLCTVSYKNGNESFEIYYPKECQDIFDRFVGIILFSDDQSEEKLLRIFDFASSVIDTQKTFAYNLIRLSFVKFIKEILQQVFDPKKFSKIFENANNSRKLEHENWEVLASISKLLSKIFINFNTNSKSSRVYQLLYLDTPSDDGQSADKDSKSEENAQPQDQSTNINPLSGIQTNTNPLSGIQTNKNPLNGIQSTKANPISGDQSLIQNQKPSVYYPNEISSIWRTIVDFIFFPNKKYFKSIIKDKYAILTVARLLKYIICIFLDFNYKLPEMCFINTFLKNTLMYLFKEEIKYQPPESTNRQNGFYIRLKEEIDLNDFRTYKMHPHANEKSYYIDVDRLYWFAKGKVKNIEELIENVKELNQLLFTVECKTELISAIHSFIKIYLEKVAYQVTDDSNSNKLQIDYDELLHFAADVLTINFLPMSTIEEVFKLFETINKLPAVLNEDKLFSFGAFNYFLKAACKFLEKSPCSIVFKVVTMLLQLMQDDLRNRWYELNNVLANLFKIACRFISTEAPDENATSLVIEVSLIVQKDPSILKDDNAIIYLSFFKNVINTKFAVHALKSTMILCSTAATNLEKIGFFDYLISIIEPGQNSLTKDSPLWPYIFSIFLTLPSDSPITEKFICKSFPYITFFLSEKILSDNDINLGQTQESIAKLVAHVSINASRLATENPSTLQALVELIYIQLELSSKALKIIAETDNYNKFQNLVNIEKHDIQTSSILIIHSCLFAINNLISHPFMVLPRGFQKKDANQSMMNLLVNAIDDFCKIKIRIDKYEKEHESEKRLHFSKILCRSTEMAAQLFCGLCVSSLSNTNLNKDEKQKIKDKCQKFSNSIRNITEKRAEGFDIGFLTKVTEKVESKFRQM